MTVSWFLFSVVTSGFAGSETQDWSSGWVPLGAITLQPGLWLYRVSSAELTWNITSDPLPTTTVGVVADATDTAVTDTPATSATASATRRNRRPVTGRLSMFMGRRTSSFMGG